MRAVDSEAFQWKNMGDDVLSHALDAEQMSAYDTLESEQAWKDEAPDEREPDFEDELFLREKIKQKRKPQSIEKRSFSPLLRWVVVFGVVIAVLSAYLIREEKVASATAEINKLQREIDTLALTHASRKTQYECSTDLELIRRVAAESLNMGDWNEDQVSEIDYQDSTAFQMDYQGTCAALVAEMDASSGVTAAEQEAAAITAQNNHQEPEPSMGFNVEEREEPAQATPEVNLSTPNVDTMDGFFDEQGETPLEEELDVIIPEENTLENGE